MKKIIMTKQSEGIYTLSTKENEIIYFMMDNVTNKSGKFNSDKFIQSKFKEQFPDCELEIETALIPEMFGIKLPYLGKNFN